MTELVFDAVSAGYGERAVLAEGSARLAGPGLVALAGPNGAGKSTLLKLAAGLMAPTRGAVTLDGQAVADLSPRARARRVAYLAPDGRSAWPMSVHAVAALGRAPFLKPLRQMGPDDEAEIERALARTGVLDLAERRCDELSSGEKARVLLARALAVRAEVLVLDEPIAALDIRHQLDVMRILREEADAGALVLVAIHALDLATRHADRVLVLDRGRLSADGPPERALAPDVLREVFGVFPGPAGFEPVAE
ncbi:ABC transporter ATP-binding protein [Maricaulis sp. CAU 1757]